MSPNLDLLTSKIKELIHKKSPVKTGLLVAKTGIEPVTSGL